jgi:hypothetical protein
MDLKALEQGYNSLYILLPLGSIFNFNFNRKYSSPNCHSKVVTLLNTIVLD